jgi:gliding motility-associated-like protein
MKRITLLVSFLWIVSFPSLTPLWGQVIVNGGFESLAAMPNTTGQWSLATGWTSTGSSSNTPDVFHIQGAGGGDLPETPVAIVSPYQGMAVGGFTACGDPGTNRREYITGTFSSPLLVGESYQLTFRMTNGELTTFSEGGLGISNLGMHFSMGPLQQLGAAPLVEVPHFTLTPVFHSREWETISFTFVAQAAWTHFTWGAFGFDGERTISIEEGSSPSMAYCFVDGFALTLANDDVTVDEDEVRGPGSKPQSETVNLETEASWFVPNAFTPNGDGENDVFEPVWNNVTVKRFEVFTRWGERVFELNGQQTAWDGSAPDGSPVESGMYIWQLELKEASGKTISESGAITLIR